MPTDLAEERAAGSAPLVSTVLPLLAAGACGAVLPVQSRVNGVLSEQVGALPAATLSFGSGLVVLTLLLGLAPLRRRAAVIWSAVRSGGLRRWQVVGGVGGALLVASQTYAVPQVGVTAFLVAVIGGQSVSALLVDRVGLGPGPAQPLRVGRAAAALLAVVGVAVASSARPADDGPGGGAGVGFALALTLVCAAGALTSVQQALNGVVTTVSRAPVATAWVNFLTGTLTLVLIGLVSSAAGGLRPSAVAPGLPWWAWTGGVMGIVFIALAAYAVQHLPVLVFALVTITTQLLVGMLLDALDPVGRAALGPQLLLGVLLALTASVWAALARPSRRRGVSSPAAAPHR
ncbi:DMT family transporter [Serinicoccus sediminis]|uniref:DMT family transporter n=1 Tax=Serinicoccus sediminis TaxID=2306021 RepID=UPI00101F7C32|nr:DMT family transporter [Serinicoccus sediminis]